MKKRLSALLLALAMVLALTACGNTEESAEDEETPIQEETVHRLKKYDAENGTAFTETIHAYFAAFCSVQKTAKALYVHYNTIRYRMERIKALFGWDLMNLSDCVYLYVGFHVDEYLEESQA